MEQIEVSRIGIAQLAQLQSIGKKTFQETFAAGNTEANMQAYLTTMLNSNNPHLIGISQQSHQFLIFKLKKLLN